MAKRPRHIRKSLPKAIANAVKKEFKIGDIVQVTHYTPACSRPGVNDELGTEALFRRIVGRRYRIMGFDSYGHIELHPTRHDWIWIGAEDVKLAGRAKRRGKKKKR